VLQDLFDLDEVPDFQPRYNIAPTQAVPGIAQGADGRVLKWLQWGLIPSWAKDPAIGQKMINARGETLLEKPSFRNAFRRRRCLLPADGFFEWVETTPAAAGGAPAKPYKQPYYVKLRSGEPFAFAGLWEYWETADGGPIESCAIITTEPNEVLREVHGRMPVILAKEEYRDWLETDAKDAEKLLSLLDPYPPEELELYPVTRSMSNPRFDDPACIMPLAS